MNNLRALLTLRNSEKNNVTQIEIINNMMCITLLVKLFFKKWKENSNESFSSIGTSSKHVLRVMLN